MCSRGAPSDAGPGLAAIVVSLGAAGAGAFILAGASVVGAIAVLGPLTQDGARQW